jgi:hypothetical protein
MNDAYRDAIVDQASAMSITLDGEPALLCGRLCRFPVIARRDGKGGGVEYSWQAVANVLNNRGGAFVS